MTAFPLELKSENLGWKAAMYQGNLHIPTHKPSVTEEPRPMFKLAKSSFYDMFSTQLANSKSSVISGSSSSGLVLALLPLQITCQTAYRGSETQVKLKVEPPKFEFWAGFRTLTPVIYGESETRPLQITCQIAYRSSETQV